MKIIISYFSIFLFFLHISQSIPRNAIAPILLQRATWISTEMGNIKGGRADEWQENGRKSKFFKWKTFNKEIYISLNTQHGILFRVSSLLDKRIIYPTEKIWMEFIFAGEH